MTLTIQQIYERYSVRDFCRKVEIKRLKTDGTYETDWQNVETLSGLKLLDKSVQSINYKLSNNSYNFGIVSVGNVILKLNSKNGQFDDESNSGSIFKNGYVRHESLVRIRDGYVDKYTDPNNPVEVYETVFQGFIDVTSQSTKVDDENLIQDLQCIDMLSFLLKKYTLDDMGTLSSTDIDSLIYEILNRTEFTTFFTVDALNINAGYNITSFDVTQYENQTELLTLFQNISIGHSFFYVKNEAFYYQEITTGNALSFTLDKKKLIKFAQYSSGINNVYEKFYWEEQPAITFTASPNKYNKSQTINIKGATDNTQRQNVLNKIGNVAKVQRREFKVTMPYFMPVFIMDKITINSPDIYPSDAFIWGVSRWGEGKRWRKSLKADNIPNNQEWLVKDVKHSNYQTQLLMQEIIV